MTILSFPDGSFVDRRGLLRDPPAVSQEGGDFTDAPSLMDRIAAGERSALDELLRMGWGQVVAYASRFQGDEDVAFDVAQETFLRIWERRGEWKGGSVRAYLFRIARNVTVDEVRRRDARRRAESKSGMLEGPGPRTPDRVVSRNELLARVDEAIQELPPRRREAFTLVYLHGLPYRDAADVMGVSVKTVENHLVAAVTELRRTMAPFLDPDTDR